MRLLVKRCCQMWNLVMDMGIGGGGFDCTPCEKMNRTHWSVARGMSSLLCRDIFLLQNAGPQTTGPRS